MADWKKKKLASYHTKIERYSYATAFQSSLRETMKRTVDEDQLHTSNKKKDEGGSMYSDRSYKLRRVLASPESGTALVPHPSSASRANHNSAAGSSVMTTNIQINMSFHGTTTKNTTVNAAASDVTPGSGCGCEIVISKGRRHYPVEEPIEDKIQVRKYYSNITGRVGSCYSGSNIKNHNDRKLEDKLLATQNNDEEKVDSEYEALLEGLTIVREHVHSTVLRAIEQSQKRKKCYQINVKLYVEGDASQLLSQLIERYVDCHNPASPYQDQDENNMDQNNIGSDDSQGNKHHHDPESHHITKMRFVDKMLREIESDVTKFNIDFGQISQDKNSVAVGKCGILDRPLTQIVDHKLCCFFHHV